MRTTDGPVAVEFGTGLLREEEMAKIEQIRRGVRAGGTDLSRAGQA